MSNNIEVGDIVLFKDKDLSEMVSFGIVIEQIFFDDYLGEFDETKEEPWFLVIFGDIELIVCATMVSKIT
jgi:hypothetical protein